MPPSPLGLLEVRREAARARVEDLEAELERLEDELESARAVRRRCVVAEVGDGRFQSVRLWVGRSEEDVRWCVRQALAGALGGRGVCDRVGRGAAFHSALL